LRKTETGKRSSRINPGPSSYGRPNALQEKKVLRRRAGRRPGSLRSEEGKKLVKGETSQEERILLPATRGTYEGRKRGTCLAKAHQAKKKRNGLPNDTWTYVSAVGRDRRSSHGRSKKKGKPKVVARMFFSREGEQSSSVAQKLSDLVQPAARKSDEDAVVLLKGKIAGIVQTKNNSRENDPWRSMRWVKRPVGETVETAQLRAGGKEIHMPASKLYVWAQ